MFIEFNDVLFEIFRWVYSKITLVYACNPSLAKLQNFTLLIRSIFMAFYSVLAIVLPQHLHLQSCPIPAVKTDRPPRLVGDIKHIPLSILYNRHACLGVFLYIYLDGVFVRKLVFLATAPFGFSTEHAVLEYHHTAGFHVLCQMKTDHISRICFCPSTFVLVRDRSLKLGTF